jgi:hypothetical protein
VFNPNLFLRGTGGTSAFVLSGSTITFTDPDATKKFDQGLVGKEIQIVGATTPGNNGPAFRIRSVPTPNSLTWENAAGASETFAGAGTYRIRTVNDKVPKAMLWAQTIRVINAGGGDLEISFDGVNVHGLVPAGLINVYRNRFEAGIAIRGNGVSYVIEAW